MASHFWMARHSQTPKALYTLPTHIIYADGGTIDNKSNNNT